MEYEKIKQLINDMGNSKLSDIDITFPDGTKISMKKESQLNTLSTNQECKENITINNEELHSVEIEKKQEGNIVKSPMVGTFYMKPSLTANPYVEIGKEIKQGETLCIIEAMKLMNEIESEFSGKVLDILVKDGDTVEYGTPLFRIG